jgi:hypothetical protein
VNGAAEFTAPNDQGVVQHSVLLQIADQRGRQAKPQLARQLSEQPLEGTGRPLPATAANEYHSTSSWVLCYHGRQFSREVARHEIFI